MSNEKRFYIATDGLREAIFGIGTTAEEAGDDARALFEEEDEPSYFLIMGATERLYRKIEADGGAPGDVCWTDDAPRSLAPDLADEDYDATRYTADLDLDA